MLREAAPIALLLIGAIGGVVWTIALGGRLYSSPPYLFATGIAMAVALLLATRGAPRWGYPWMAMGIVGTQALMWVLLTVGGGATPSALSVGVATLGGPVLAAVIGGVIATRNWGDSAFFAGLYLAGANLALPILLLPPDGGARADIEMWRIVLAGVQAALTAAAILFWNRDRAIYAIGMLGIVIVVSAVAAGILVPGSRADVPEDIGTFWGAAQGLFRITLFVVLISFAIGGVRRVFSGQGLLAPLPPPTHAAEPDDEEDTAPPLFPEPADANDDRGEDAAPRDEPPARRRRRRRRGRGRRGGQT